MNILKSKKGIAIENAILFMMIIFSLCFLIASLTLIGHYQGEIENVTLENKLELAQIGEDYIASLNGGSAFQKEGYDGYTCSVDDENKILEVYVGENTVLYVQSDNDGKPIVWRYSAP